MASKYKGVTLYKDETGAYFKVDEKRPGKYEPVNPGSAMRTAIGNGMITVKDVLNANLGNTVKSASDDRENNPQVFENKPDGTNPDDDGIDRTPESGRLAYEEKQRQGIQPQQQGQVAGASVSVQPQTPISTYTGSSIVDFLNSTGQASDYNTRAQLAAQQGIQNYTGSASQNTQLLNALRSQQTKSQPVQQVQTGNVSGNVSMDDIRKQAALTPQENLAIEQAKTQKSPAQSGLESYGLDYDDDTLSSVAQANPVKFVSEIYNEMYKNAGLGSIKKEYESLNKEYEKLQNEMSDGIVEINDNPWLTEGVRQRQIQKIQEKYEGRLSNLTNRLTLEQSMYETGVAQVKYITDLAVGQYNQNLKFQQDLYLTTLDNAQKQAEAEFDQAYKLAQLDIDKQKLEIDRFKASQSGSGGNSITAQVIDGFQKISDLTPSQKTAVKSELYGMGFGSDTPPQWFIEFVQNLPEFDNGQFGKSSVDPNYIRQEWIKYRDSILNENKSTGTDTLDFNNF